MHDTTLINPLANAYALKYSSQTDSLLQEIEKYTLEEHAHASMLSGPLQGKLLEMICLTMQPETVLEIGTFTGYSALCLAKGLPSHGQLHTIEIREEDAKTCQGYFDRSAYQSQIHLHVGNALEIVPSLEFQWDLVFIDADKTNYIQYYELTLPRLKTNGLMMVDNVLFHGKVLDEKIIGKNALAIHAFNNHVANDQRVEQVILTVRDGLMFIRKR